MPFIETKFPGLKVFNPKVFGDARGYFFECYNVQTFEKEGAISNTFVQDNESLSSYGVLRGLHYQLEPYAQAKLVRVLQGEVLDVVVDIREGSPTYGQHFSILLSQENKKNLFIPRGFAHGFIVLSEQAIFHYKCDNFYSKEHERGILCTDGGLNIDWKVDASKFLLSEKDRVLPAFGKQEANFKFIP